MTDDVQRIADALARRLGRPVAVDDPQMTLIAHTAHASDVDVHRVASVMQLRAPEDVVAHAYRSGIASAVAPVRVPGIEAIGLHARICVPVRCQGVLLAYLWLIDAEGSITDEELVAAVEAAAAAGEVLFRERLLDDLDVTRQRELVRDLLSEDGVVRGAALAQLVEAEVLPQACLMAAVVVQVEATDRDDVRTVLDTVLRTCGRRVQPLVALSLPRGDGRAVLLLAGRRAPAPERLREVADDVRQELLIALRHDGEVRIGIGPVVTDPLAATSSVRRAQQVLEVAAAVEGLGHVTAWSQLGIYRLLVQLPLDSPDEDVLPDGLRALVAADGGGPLVETLETWLDEGCDPRRTVARLQVHRTSLYYRLGRIEELSGMALSDGRDRLALHLGLKLARLRGL